MGYYLQPLVKVDHFYRLMGERNLSKMAEDQAATETLPLDLL
jgi:hypothetical protein